MYRTLLSHSRSSSCSAFARHTGLQPRQRILCHDRRRLWSASYNDSRSHVSTTHNSSSSTVAASTVSPALLRHPRKKASFVAWRSFQATPSCWDDKTEEGNAAADDSTPPKQYSYPELTADAQKHKEGLSDSDRPNWQNPLHHNNPDMDRMFEEDFSSKEEFESHVLPAPPLEGQFPAHVNELAEEMTNLTMMEMNELINKMGEHYGFREDMLNPTGDGGGGGSGGGGEDDDDEEGGGAAEAKTAFDIKLVSFDAKAKIKLIKECRSIVPGLGLKEAKAMVEGAPVSILKDIKMEDAEPIKAKLEELGAVVEIV